MQTTRQTAIAANTAHEVAIAGVRGWLNVPASQQQIEALIAEGPAAARYQECYAAAVAYGFR
jgi:hypothetical protein